jgi:hypothetical protein
MASCRFEQDKGEKERGVLCWMRSMQTEQQMCGRFYNGMTKKKDHALPCSWYCRTTKFGYVSFGIWNLLRAVMGD